MPSVEKKIRQAGWSKRPYKEARNEIDRFVQTDGTARTFKRSSHGKCRKTRGEHKWVFVKPNGMPDRNDPDKIQYWANVYSQENVDKQKWNASGSSWYWPREPRKCFKCSACGKMKLFNLGK